MTPKKKLFKTNFPTTNRPPDPEALFRDLKGRSSAIRHLWSHQADVLRIWFDKHLRSPDVAFELPTGTGKTLIGLLVGEFRRRAFDERVVYLAPNRMLAKQVGAQASQYGIPAHVLVGPQEQYPEADFDAYQMNSAIAITTYSGLFNSNPRIRDPHVIVLDDAHAGEGFIASMWSVELTRWSHGDLLKAIFELFTPDLPPWFVDLLRRAESPAEIRVELLPGPYFRSKLSALRDLLNSHLSKRESAWYGWRSLEAHLHACNLFLSVHSILFRPIIPPTHTHPPFASARQRLYMSATLGEGGELERITGVRSIGRIPVPQGWEKQGSGRRLFLLPTLSLADNRAEAVAIDACRVADRALALVPNTLAVEDLVKVMSARGFSIFSATDIEDSLAPFSTAHQAVLVLANRYDGIDLPDEDCRLLLLYGLPAGTHLQEYFLLSRLAAVSLLRDRMVTRLTQAVGRCTRSDTDYAAVILVDRQLVSFALKSETRAILHPELQAEIEFGIRNSQDQASEGFLELLRSFLEQDSEWQAADQAIKSLRAGKTRATDPVAERLKRAAFLEVEYIQALWRNDALLALEKARAVADCLGGDETKGYRAWWYYLAADAALMAYGVKPETHLVAVAKDLFGRACGCLPSISWLAELSRVQFNGVAMSSVVDPIGAQSTERVVSVLKRLGFWGPSFEAHAKGTLELLSEKDHESFVRGLKYLGEYLGFESETPPGDAAPDCLWSLNGLLYIVLEVKTEQTPSDPISPDNARQASGHARWVRAHRDAKSGVPVVAVLVTPRGSVHKDALPHADGVYHFAPSRLKELAESVIGCLRQCRVELAGASDERLLEELQKAFVERRLDPGSVKGLLEGRPVKGLRRP